MNEALLQFIWNFKKLKHFDFKDIEGNDIEVLNFGTWNHNSGPDFSLAKIKIGKITLVGNIELHVKSSDWLLHGHSGNQAFENIILHVVFENDTDLEFLREKNIPTLVLKDYIDEALLWKYAKMQEDRQFIPCEDLITNEKIPFQFAEEILLKKLDEKSIEYQQQLIFNKNNFEALLFQQLAYAFGLRVNAASFLQMASSVDYAIINKIRQKQNLLEALFYGLSGWLQKPMDEKTKIWLQEFHFLKAKFQLPNLQFEHKFSKLRPPSFPTIRLSQLSNLYGNNQNLFSVFIEEGNLTIIRKVLSTVKADEYWDSHFTFGKETAEKAQKKLSKDFIDLLLYNCILPMQYFFRKQTSENAIDDTIEQYQKMPAEKNNVITSWQNLGIEIKTGLQSQAFLYQYKNFCTEKKCLNCGIGYQLLKNV